MPRLPLTKRKRRGEQMLKDVDNAPTLPNRAVQAPGCLACVPSCSCPDLDLAGVGDPSTLTARRQAVKKPLPARHEHWDCMLVKQWISTAPREVFPRLEYTAPQWAALECWAGWSWHRLKRLPGKTVTSASPCVAPSPPHIAVASADALATVVFQAWQGAASGPTMGGGDWDWHSCLYPSCWKKNYPNVTCAKCGKLGLCHSDCRGLVSQLQCSQCLALPFRQAAAAAAASAGC